MTVQLKDGRQVTGEVADLSDDDRLWLSSVNERVSLYSGFLWDDVESITEGEPQNILRLESPPPPLPVVSDQPAHVPLPSPPVQDVRTLRIAAVLTNWDRGAETDGLEVLVTPLGCDWQTIPVDAQMTFELLTEFDPLTSSEGRTLPRRVNMIERWTIRLSPEHFGPNGAVIELPFRRFRPDIDCEVAPVGRLVGRLGLPGQGAYEAYSDVLLRESSPLTAE